MTWELMNWNQFKSGYLYRYRTVTDKFAPNNCIFLPSSLHDPHQNRPVICFWVVTCQLRTTAVEDTENCHRGN